MIEAWIPCPAYSWWEKEKGKPRIRKSASHPCTKGNNMQIIRKGKHPSIVQRPKAIAAEAALAKVLRSHSARPWPPLSGPVVLHVEIVFVPPTSWANWKQEAALKGDVYATSHHLGDRGQLLKLLEDALERAGWYTDDAHVVAGPVEKRYGPEAGYQLWLEELQEPQNAKEWANGGWSSASS